LAKNIRHYEDALSRARGEGFNIFEILQIDHYEVRTHSPILAELLDPKGSHGQGAVFLRRFLSELKIQDFDAESARVDRELYIPGVGRLDIQIRDRNGHCVIIENKIYAALQEDQLVRYHACDPKANLLFLTLKGEQPKDWSTNDLYAEDSFKKVFQLVSYRTHILRWLEACRKEAATSPGVRETITQYIHLIQHLTQQNTSVRMNQELIKEVLKDKENFMAYTALRNADQGIHATIIDTLKGKLNTVAGELKLDVLKQPEGDMSVAHSEFNLSSPLLKRHGLGISIEFENSGYRECYVGFYNLKQDDKSPVTVELQREFKLEFGSRCGSPTEVVPAWLYWEPKDWNDETFAAIQFGDFATELKALLERFLRVADRCCTVPHAALKP
jgi:hypothetical protein